MSARGFIIGAPRSGAGKTSVTIGLLRAMRRRGLRVRGVKSGPDYIDPGFHAVACGAAGVNLDCWAMPPDYAQCLATSAAAGMDIVVIESAMGLFDGVAAPAGRSGAAADLARLLRLPVVLVLDVSGQSQTAAAVALGFANYDPGVRIGGVILNRVGSDRHRRLVTGAIERLGLPVLGSVPRDPTIALPERHLGLVQAREQADAEHSIERLADAMERYVDIAGLLDIAAPLAAGDGAACAALPPPGQRIAIADDAAFSFLYPHVASHWRDIGAELIPFSPLADQAPDTSCDACWLPGGYPELHGGSLAAAHNFKAGMRAFAAAKPVHGECGGYMVMGEGLEDASGAMHAMLGLLSHCTSFAHRRMNLGYRQARLLADGPLGQRDEVIRGHEFHYATVTSPGRDTPFAELADSQGAAIGPVGGRRGLVTGAFFHAIARGD